MAVWVVALTTHLRTRIPEAGVVVVTCRAEVARGGHSCRADTSNTYDDVSLGDYVRSSARTTVDEAIGRCLAEPSALTSAVVSLATGMSAFTSDLESGPLLNRLKENVPTGPIEGAVLIGQGEFDQHVLADVQAEFVARQCAAGQAVDYRTYPGARPRSAHRGRLAGDPRTHRVDRGPAGRCRGVRERDCSRR